MCVCVQYSRLSVISVCVRVFCSKVYVCVPIVKSVSVCVRACARQFVCVHVCVCGQYSLCGRLQYSVCLCVCVCVCELAILALVSHTQ